MQINDDRSNGSVVGGGVCPLVAAFEEIRTGGLSSDPDDNSAVVFLGGGQSTSSEMVGTWGDGIVWNESEYWLAYRTVAAARGQLEDARAAFDRLYPGGYAPGHELLETIMRESPVVRQMKLLKPVLESLRHSIISRVSAAAIRGQSINISVGTLPDIDDIPADTAHIPGVVNRFVDFVNTLNVVALGASKPSKIAHMPYDHLPMVPRNPVRDLAEGHTEDIAIVAIGKLHEDVHKSAAGKLSEIFVACVHISEGLTKRSGI